MTPKIKGILSILFYCSALYSQMQVGGDIFYGNEWIRYDKDYLKIKVARDGIYRIGYQDFLNAGIDPGSLDFSKLPLFNMGLEQPVFLSSNSNWGPGDYLLFSGRTNRSYLDKFLYADPEKDLLNPEYSLITDTNVYFLLLEPDETIRERFEITANDTNNLPGAEAYCIRSTIFKQSENFIKRPNIVGSLSRMGNGESFSGPALVSQNISLPAYAYKSTGPAAKLKLNISANNSRNHELLLLWNQEEMDRRVFNNFQFIREEYSIDSDKLQELNTFSFTRMGAAENRYSLACISLTYPAETRAQNNSPIFFKIEGSGIKHLRWEGPFNEEMWLFDLGNKKIIRENPDQGIVAFGVVQDQENEYLLISPSQFLVAEGFEKIRMKRQMPGDADFLLLFQPGLQFSQQGIDIIEKYAEYRASSGKIPWAVNVNELYDQFSYGIDRHFIALRNFFAYLKKSDTDLTDILLVGKGRDISTIRTSEQLANAKESFFIPTFGVPGSDNLLVCPNHTIDQKFAIGRIPAINAEEVALYLDKVIAYEANQEHIRAESIRNWQKRIIHISGGRNTAEQNQLRGIMDQLKTNIEGSLFGANVFSFSKQSSEPVQGSAPEQIYQLINTGSSLISFMGHSGSTTLDYDIDNLGIYTNKDLYPFFLALGCSVGNIHTPIRSYGERFNLSSQKGTILFYSSSGLGYPVTLEPYALSIYKKMGESKATGFGEIIRTVHYENRLTPNKLLQETIEQHNLNGDPSLKFNYYQYPDYTPDYSSVEIGPGVISISSDSIEIKLNILNIGLNTKDSIDIEIRLVAPDQQTETFRISNWPTKRYSTEFLVKLSFGAFSQTGRFTMYLEIDPDQKLNEGPLPDAKFNNLLRDLNGMEGFPFQVQGDKPKLIYPRNYEMIREEDFYLRILAGNPFELMESVILQIDTTAGFDSSLHESVTLNLTEGNLKYNFPIQGLDSTTYYWRIGEVGDGEILDTIWQQWHSFTIIKGLSGVGYGQFHKNQFKGSSFLPDKTGIWKYPTNDRQYLIRNSLFSNSSYPAGFFEGERIPGLFPFSIIQEGIIVVVLDPSSGRPLINPPGGRWGSINSSSNDLISFPYNTRQQGQRAALISTLNDSIPDGATVFLYSILRTAESSYGIKDWAADSISIGSNLFIVFEQQGLPEIRDLESFPDFPFILAFKKNVSPLGFERASQKQDTILYSHVISEAGTNGAYNWELTSLKSLNQISWAITEATSGSSKFLINLEQVNEPYSDSISLISKQDVSLERKSSVSPTLRFYSENDLSLAHQLRFWAVSGAEFPDPGWVFISSDQQTNDSIPRGKPIHWKMVLKNFSSTGAVNIPIAISVTDRMNKIIRYDLDPISLDSFEQKEIGYTLYTKDMEGGSVKIAFLIDPDETIDEIIKDNNSAEIEYHIEVDKQNPLLQVYFDGISIMDGDMVSSRPEITIQLRDYNKYLKLNDTSLFDIQLKSPGQETFNRIGFDSPDIFFRQAEEESKNEAIIIYKPGFLADGEHILQIQAKDVSGNPAGDHPYRIRFKVINKSMISALSNYPNPFSSRTRFLYTLTGHTSPSVFAIQVYSISGKLVKEISHLETGPLKPGTHLTDYEWDGTDQFGNKLANGVYLFRLNAQNEEGDEMEHFSSKLDSFSKSGWSKLVILR